jgi:pantoate kinase
VSNLKKPLKAKRTAEAFVPGHVTGFFRIHDEFEDPHLRGSTGSGFCINAGTTTRLSTRPAETTTISVVYNGSLLEAPVTDVVVSKMLEDNGVTMDVRVDYTSDLPIGTGYGASGAGALGAAITLDSLLHDEYDLYRAGRYAHYAEVVNHTGLGDIIAQTVGGLEIRLKPGAPGIGDARRISDPTGRRVVLAGSPGIETRFVLTNPETKGKINRAGERLTERLDSAPSFETFIECSRLFAESTNLMPERVADALSGLERAGFSDSSMVMLGDAVFCFCEGDAQAACRILAEHYREDEVMVTEIYYEGGALRG